jgi:hypothetical protein
MAVFYPAPALHSGADRQLLSHPELGKVPTFTLEFGLFVIRTKKTSSFTPPLTDIPKKGGEH